VNGSLRSPINDEDQSSFISLAAKCRRLADAISDGPTRECFIKLAEDYESRSHIEAVQPNLPPITSA